MLPPEAADSSEGIEKSIVLSIPGVSPAPPPGEALDLEPLEMTPPSMTIESPVPLEPPSLKDSEPSSELDLSELPALESELTAAAPPSEGIQTEVIPETPPAQETSSAVVPPALSDTSDSQGTPAAQVTIDRLKDFSEKMAPGGANVEAAFPFSLSVEGPLDESFREKITDFIEREKLGITKEDLAPQWAAGKVLIPQISEYAGILLVQLLRSSGARLRLVPADHSEDTQSGLLFQGATDPASSWSVTSLTEDAQVPAEYLPVTIDREIPELGKLSVIDTVTASAVLKSQAVEITRSSEYQEVLDALHREIKYRAHRKGAAAVTQFQVSLIALPSGGIYRLMAAGVAVRKQADTGPRNSNTDSAVESLENGDTAPQRDDIFQSTE